MNFLQAILTPYQSVFTSPLFAIFTLLSLSQVWQGVRLGQSLWQERHQFWPEPLTGAKQRRLESAAFFLAVPPGVLLHELGHAVVVWLYGGRVLEFGFFFFWGYVLPDRTFAPLQEWVLSSAGTWASLLYAALWGLVWYRSQSSVIRFFARRVVRFQIFFALIYYPLFTLALPIGDWRTIYDFSLAPTAAAITAVLHALILVAHIAADRMGLYEQPAFPSLAAQQALGQLAQRAQAKPTDLEAQDTYLSELMRAGAPAQAQWQLRRLLRQHPNWADGHLTMAVALASAQRRIPRTAVRHAETALKLGVSDPRHKVLAHNLLGDHYLERERYATAEEHFTAALLLWPTPSPESPANAQGQAVLYNKRALTHRRQRNWAAAQADWENALRLAQQLPLPELAEQIRQQLRQLETVRRG